MSLLNLLKQIREPDKDSTPEILQSKIAELEQKLITVSNWIKVIAGHATNCDKFKFRDIIVSCLGHRVIFRPDTGTPSGDFYAVHKWEGWGKQENKGCVIDLEAPPDGKPFYKCSCGLDSLLEII